MNDLEKILDFIQKYLKYKDRELLRAYIKEHEKYHTLDYAIDTNGNIVAFCRWNMDGNTAKILDFAIDYKFQRRGIGRDFIMRALKKFPKIKKIEFKRGVRGDNRLKILPIKEILKKRVF